MSAFFLYGLGFVSYMKYNIPPHPGCYLMKDSAGSVIYVGKAKDLRKRVASYFDKKHDYAKTNELVKHVSDVDYIVTDNEVEALLLENRLIKQHMPHYNIMFKDSKTYAYIILTHEEYPRILSVRDLRKYPGALVFGPYVDGTARWKLMRFAQKLFKIRTCRKLPKKVCLLYHIKRCTGPCEQKVSIDNYTEQVKRCALFLKGDNASLIKELKEKMSEASKKLAFEEAKECRDIIDTLEAVDTEQKVDLIKKYDEDFISFVRRAGKIYIGMFIVHKGTITSKHVFSFLDGADVFTSFVKQYYSDHPIPKVILLEEPLEEMAAIGFYLSSLAGSIVALRVPMRGDKRKLLDLVKKNILLSLKYTNEELDSLRFGLSLSEVPRVIDCFDMSNFGDKIQVGSCVRFVDGKPFKEAYRRFRIKSFLGQDDFAAMYECVKRRYHKYKESGLELPSLIVVDGGKGQLSMAAKALDELGLNITVVGLAKQKEEVFFVHKNESLELGLQHKGLNLLRRIRDEAHRFVITYIRLLRDKEMLK